MGLHLMIIFAILLFFFIKNIWILFSWTASYLADTRGQGLLKANSHEPIYRAPKNFLSCGVKILMISTDSGARLHMIKNEHVNVFSKQFAGHNQVDYVFLDIIKIKLLIKITNWLMLQQNGKNWKKHVLHELFQDVFR